MYKSCYAYYQQKNERSVPQDSDDDQTEQYEQEAKQQQRMLNEESLKKIADKLDILLPKWYNECTQKYSTRQKKREKKTAHLFSTNENSIGSQADSKSSIEIKDQQTQESFISRLKSNNSEQNQYNEIEVKFPEGLENEKKQKNYVEFNKQQTQNKKSFLNEIRGINKEIFLSNIPKILKNTHFDRRDLHNIYILYKTLHEVTSQRYPHSNYNIHNGLDFDTFRNGIYHIFVQSEELAKKIFNTTDINELGQFQNQTRVLGFLNWENFLQLMVSIKAKTLREKIDLFIKICDEDGNGMLSEEEIINLSKVCLSKYICQSEGSEKFLDDLCQYFADLIFSSVGYSKDGEIPLKDIKKAILYDNNKEQALLTMFCGADI